MSDHLDSIEDILADVRAGKMVVMMDHEDRENEGDLILAASCVRPEDINFMARFGRGLICLTLTRKRCRQLQLPLMVSQTDKERTTNFTVSIEAAHGITTGISAHDRARTIQVAVANGAKPADLHQPGHVFPLMAQPGGVLTRAGHTEAGCDLARLAGFEPAATIVEVLNEDGTMARRAELHEFAQAHNLKIGSIADLISYRLAKEKSVERIGEYTVTTEYGEFRVCCFEDHVHRSVHLALVRGDVGSEEPTLVRVHVQDTLSDVLGVDWHHLGWPLRDAMRKVAAQGTGVVVVLRPEQRPGELMELLEMGPEGAPPAATSDDDLRTYGIGAQILRDLGVHKMRVLSAPKRFPAISGFGLEVVEYVDHEREPA